MAEKFAVCLSLNSTQQQQLFDSILCYNVFVCVCVRMRAITNWKLGLICICLAGFGLWFLWRPPVIVCCLCMLWVIICQISHDNVKLQGRRDGALSAWQQLLTTYFCFLYVGTKLYDRVEVIFSIHVSLSLSLYLILTHIRCSWSAQHKRTTDCRTNY